MSIAYVDTSAVLAIAFHEPEWEAVAVRMGSYSGLTSSNLLEAEVRSAYAREGRTFVPGVLSEIEWIFPDRSLSTEIAPVLNTGYLRGADLWHVATALYISPEPDKRMFLTLDNHQRAVAAALGFQT